MPILVIMGDLLKSGATADQSSEGRPDRWFDAHLDLATLVVEGRDITVPLVLAKGQPQPAAITLPSLAQGTVSHCLATIFTAPDLDGPCGYSSSNTVDSAHEAGVMQLRVYERLVRFEQMTPIGIGSIADSLPDGNQNAPIRFHILMEGADPIRDPDEVEWWYDRGVRAVGISWARGTRYGGGNGKPGPLTHLGRELIHAMDEVGMIHDLSHLPDEAAWQLLETARGSVMASHSNCRALVDGVNQRHLPDDLIKAIVERNGMIGLNLFGRFLVQDGDKRRPSISETIAHVLHVVELAGGRKDAVGLGSDMDGGFGADQMPDGIDQPADLHRLTDALIQEAKWSASEAQDFAFNNWARFLDRVRNQRSL